MSRTDNQRPEPRPLLWVLTLIIFALGVAVTVSLAPQGVAFGWEAWQILPLLAFLAGLFPARFGGLRINVTTTHPFVFCAMVVAGPVGAVTADLAGLAGALIGRRKRPVPMHLVFNLGLVTLCATCASAIFTQLGGKAAGDLAGIVGPLFGASIVYFLVNSWLVSIAIAVETRTQLMEVWRRSTIWTALPFLAGVSSSLAITGVFRGPLIWVLVTAIPPVALIAVFCRQYRPRGS